MTYIRDDARDTGHGFLANARRRYREAGRSARIFGALAGLALLAFVAYIILASAATYTAIDANEDAAHTRGPTTTAPVTK